MENNDRIILVKAARSLGFAVMLFLLFTWLVGGILFVQGIFIDLDFILRNTFFYDSVWTPETVRAAATEAGIQVEVFPWYWLAIEITMVTTFVTAGLILFWRKKDLFGAYLGVTLVVIGTSITGPVISTVSSVIPEAQVFLLFLSGIGFVSLASLLYVFPDGKFIPSWSKWLMMIFVLLILVQTYVFFSELDQSESLLEIIIPMLYFSLGVISQVYRYIRVSGPVERQQTKWALVAFVLFLLVAVLFNIMFPNSTNMQEPPAGIDLVGFFLFYTGLTLTTILFLIALVIAIFRYRLYDIDILIRKSLVYSGLTVTLVLVYFGNVVLLQRLLTAFGGQQSPVAIVISTLLIAALFNPLRGRIQNAIDRRFYRRKYDAEKTLEAYAMSARNQADLDSMTSDLVQVVRATMQPERIGLWMKDTG